MAIYDFSKADKSAAVVQPHVTDNTSEEQPPISRRDQIFSTVATRLFFLLLLCADVLWIGYALLKFCIALAGLAFSGGKVSYFKHLIDKSWVSIRRSLVCGVSLLIAICNPAFGIMVACTYFLMYDKAGIEEVVPASLQSQFKDFLPKE